MNGNNPENTFREEKPADNPAGHGRTAGAVDIAEKILRYCLIAVLFFWGGMLLFVFVINWEGWIFGIRIAGLYAGLYLLAKGTISVALAALIIYLPKKRTILGALSLILFSYMLLDSEYTGQVLHPGNTSVPDIFIIFSLVSLLYLIVCIFRENSKRKDIST